MTYEIFVISNAGLFREGLNAIAAFCRSSGFEAAVWIGSAIGIMMTAYAYTKNKDLMLYLKWLATYMLVFNVLLGTTSTVVVIDTTDQTVPGQIIDGVPFGIAFPAHLITAFGYEFSSAMETAFSMPEDLEYHKTGMMFGSNLFNLSLSAKIDNPEVIQEMNDYIKSCVIGDITINHKYSFNDVLHSNDLWALITSKPSGIRGMFVSRHFNTCKQAAVALTAKMDYYASNKSPGNLARFVPTHNAYSGAAISTMLASSYQYFKAASKTGTDILKQNITINAFRSGIRNYAAESGSVAGIQNIANTTAMNNTRMAWASSRNIGMKTLPLMQVVMLLLMLCLFPLIAVLAMLPGMGHKILQGYIFSLIWLESWPIMYTILNMAMNFYMHIGDHGTVTLSNTNLLAQEHSDIAGVAGYLVLAIPFLSMGIVKGMAMTFNSAAQYLGGMMHSIAQGAASSAVSGNYSMGNVSTDNATANNISANKHDTNATDMNGMSTDQLNNGTTVTSTPGGHDIYSAQSGMSHLASKFNASQQISSSLSSQIDKSLTSASNEATNFQHSKGHNDSLGTNNATAESTQVNHAMNTISSLTQSLAQKEGISTKDAFQKMSQESGSVEASVSSQASVGFSLLGTSATVSGGITGKTGISGSEMSTHDGGHSVDVDKNISESDAKNFNESLNTVKSYSESHTASDQNTDSENIAIQMGSDMRNADRLSESAQLVKSNSAAINTDFTQKFSGYVQDKHPSEAKEVLSATEGPMLTRQQELQSEYMDIYESKINKGFVESGSNLQRGIESETMSGMNKNATYNYQNNSGRIRTMGQELGPSSSQLRELSRSSRSNISNNNETINANRKNHEIKSNNLQSLSEDKIERGRKYAEAGVFHHITHSDEG